MYGSPIKPSNDSPTHRRSRGILIASLVAVSTLASASIATAVTVVDGNYAGTTSQRNPNDHQRWPVTFTVAHKRIRNLDFNINDKCPDGSHLIVHSYGYPPINIHPKGSFSGRFGVQHGVPGEGTLIRGQVTGKVVTAQVDDFGLNKRENVLCRGEASFTARPAAAAASRAPDPRYSGKTAQGRMISFTVSGGYVRKLNYHIYDRCPGGHAIIDWDRSFTPIRIKAGGRFGGKFVDAGKATAIVSGKASGKHVTGTLTDTAKHPTYHTTCHGRTTFSLVPK